MFKIKQFATVATAIAALAMASPPPAAQAQSLVQNGSFEASYAFWTPSGSGSISPIGTANAADGSLVMAFSGQDAILSQQFTAPGGTYDYRFLAGRSESFGPFDDVPLTFVARIDGLVLTSTLPQFDVASGGRTTATRLLSQYLGSVTLASGLHTLSFEYSRGQTQFARDPFILLDGVSLTPQAIGSVPEPTTWALLILGFGTIGAAMRSRQRSATALA